jgi:NTP pyrophosphatase (non-canonical NTP hydrolase)
MNPVYKCIDEKDHTRFDVIRDKFVGVTGEAAKAIKSGNPEEVLSALANVMEIVGVAASQYQLTMNDVKQERDKKRYGSIQCLVLIDRSRSTCSKALKWM